MPHGIIRPPQARSGGAVERSQIVDAVKSYLLAEVLPGEDPDELTPTTPLVSSGVLDSLATLSLISFLEETFGVEIAPHEADEEHLETLATIADLVASKR
jgi:acyl carrier protein